MASLMLILAATALYFETRAMRRLHRSGLAEAQLPSQGVIPSNLDDLLAVAAAEISVVLDLQACWFEPFPFDTLLPRIEEGRIVLPMPEPGIAPCSGAAVELPVRRHELTLGRFVLLPAAPTVGVGFSPTGRDRAIALAGAVAEPLAAALIS